MKFKDYAKQAGFDFEEAPEIFVTPNAKSQKDYKGPICVDLFAGCGGASIGMEKGGFRVAVAVEMDQWAFLTYVTNLGMNPKKPITFFRKDIRTITGADIIDALDKMGYSPIVDAMWMSPPCKGFSMARMGPRLTGWDMGPNYCMLEAIRLLKEIRPKMFAFENVPGLNHGKMKPLWKEWQQMVHDAGYDFEWQILDAADFGVPQRRKRIIGVGQDARVIHAIDEVCFAPEFRMEAIL